MIIYIAESIQFIVDIRKLATKTLNSAEINEICITHYVPTYTFHHSDSVAATQLHYQTSVIFWNNTG